MGRLCLPTDCISETIQQMLMEFGMMAIQYVRQINFGLYWYHIVPISHELKYHFPKNWLIIQKKTEHNINSSRFLIKIFFQYDVYSAKYKETQYDYGL